jgi:uncharacterized protein (UPF0332 family)
VVIGMKWCFSIKKPVQLVEASENLAQAYILKSTDSLDMAQLAISSGKKEWAITTMYYCQYLVLYGLLQKIGIKSENHTCSIMVAAKFIPSIDKKYIEQIKKFKAERIEKQYYVAKSDMEMIDINKLNDETKEFQSYIIEKINTLTSDEVQSIRKEISEYILKSKNNSSS